MNRHIAESLHVFTDPIALSQHLNTVVQKASESASSNSRKFTIALSGGSLASQIMLEAPKTRQETSHWQILFADERCVSLTSPDSNSALFHALFKLWGIKESQVLNISQSFLFDPEKCAQMYQDELVKLFEGVIGIPELDLVLLGMGPDGHTCSLFPGHELLDEKERYVAEITDSPKPPSSRITLTLPLINASKKCVFVAIGESKSAALHRMIDGGEKLPSALVIPRIGSLEWVVDAAAVSKLDHMRVGN